MEPLLDRSQYSRFRYLNRYQLLRGEVALARAEPALVIVSLLLLIFLALLFSEAGVLSEAVESGAPVSPTATLQERR